MPSGNKRLSEFIWRSHDPELTQSTSRQPDTCRRQIDSNICFRSIIYIMSRSIGIDKKCKNLHIYCGQTKYVTDARHPQIPFLSNKTYFTVSNQIEKVIIRRNLGILWIGPSETSFGEKFKIQNIIFTEFHLTISLTKYRRFYDFIQANMGQALKR